MTQEINLKLEQAATAHKDQFNSCVRDLIPTDDHPYESFIKGAQTILENPVEWGLVPKDEFDLAESNYDFFHVKCAEAEYQLTKYRGALEHVLQLLQARRPNTPGLGAPINIIKEALKQEGEK